MQVYQGSSPGLIDMMALAMTFAVRKKREKKKKK